MIDLAERVINVNVTQNDIDKGVRENCLTCPVARAISRHFDKSYRVEVFSEVVLIFKRTTPMKATSSQAIWRSWMPIHVQDFIVAFDSKEKVEPKKFKLIFKTR